MINITNEQHALWLDKHKNTTNYLTDTYNDCSRVILRFACMMVVECGVRLACAKYAVYGMDYEGHGRSEGARCYIKKFDNIINDCYDFFKSVSGKIQIL